MELNKNELMADYLLSFIGVHYGYGEDNPMTGMDCSGLLCEGLKSVGYLAYNKRLSAQGIYNKYKESPGARSIIKKGSMLFFGKDRENITHIEIALNEFQMLGSSGGSSSTISIQIAAKIDAFIKVRPIEYRRNLIACIYLKSEV